MDFDFQNIKFRLIDGKLERLYKKGWKPCGNLNNGYYRIEINYKGYFVHRILAHIYLGLDLESELVVDHINRDRGDNRLENLRIVTQQQNRFNTNAKGYRKHQRGFKSHITLSGKCFSKCFKTEEDARNWYLEKKAELHLI